MYTDPSPLARSLAIFLRDSAMSALAADGLSQRVLKQLQ